jgi:nucleolar protein 58
MSRIVANKAALSIRVDALGDSETAQIGEENLERCERKLQQLEGREIVRSVKVPPKGAPRYDHTRSSEDPTKMKDVETYNEKSDAVLGTKRAREDPASSEDEAPKKKKAKKEEEPKKDKKKDKKKEKKSKKDDSSSEDEAPKKKSKKDKKEKKEKKEKKDKKKDKKKK